MKTQTCKTASVMSLLTKGGGTEPAPAAHQTDLAPAASERTIEAITAEILEAKRVGGEAILTIGKGLIEAKAMLSHGEWLPWLTEQVEFSERTAQNFMKLARNWSNPQALADLGATKALVLLALPPEERDAFMAGTHTVDGEEKTVIDMSARQLEQALRDREQALKDKDAAENLMERAREARDSALRELETSQAALRASEEGYAKLAQELDDLKSRPVEVAVETVVDQAAVEKARAEGEAAKAAELDALQKKLDRAQSEKDKLAIAKDKAETRQKTAEAELATVRAKLDATAKEEKRSVISGDTMLAQFQILFEQAKEISNKMKGMLIKIRRRSDSDLAEKLERALRALGEEIGGSVE